MGFVYTGFNMATKKAINRAASPMKLVEDSYEHKARVIEQQKKLVEEQVKHRSRILGVLCLSSLSLLVFLLSSKQLHQALGMSFHSRGVSHYLVGGGDYHRGFCIYFHEIV